MLLTSTKPLSNQERLDNWDHKRSQIVDEIVTTSEYWDCGCNHEYIQPSSISYCPKCDHHREDCPDSRVDEVLAHGLTLETTQENKQ